MTDIARLKELAASLRANAREPWMTIGGKPFALESAAAIDALLSRMEEMERLLTRYRNECSGAPRATAMLALNADADELLARAALRGGKQ